MSNLFCLQFTIREFGLTPVVSGSGEILINQRWNLMNLSRGLNPPKPGLN